MGTLLFVTGKGLVSKLSLDQALSRVSIFAENTLVWPLNNIILHRRPEADGLGTARAAFLLKMEF